MARNAIPTFTTNQLITAAFMNTYIKNNEAEHWSRITAMEGNLSNLLLKDVAIVGRTSNIVIDNGVESIIDWNQNISVSPPEMHSESVDKDKIYVKTAGYYLIVLNAGFEYHQTGTRRFSIWRNTNPSFLGTMIARETQNPPNTALEENHFSLSVIAHLNTDEFIRASACQGSGVPLSILHNDSDYPTLSMYLLRE